MGADTARVVHGARCLRVSQTLVFGLTVSDGTQVASDSERRGQPEAGCPSTSGDLHTGRRRHTNVARNAKIIVQFNEAMNEASLSGSMVVRAAGTMLEWRLEL